MTSNPYQAPTAHVRDAQAAVPSQHSRSLWLGVLGASVMPVVCVAVPMQLLTSPAAHINVPNFIVIGILGLVVTVPVTVVIGLPFVWLLRWRGWLSAGTVCLVAIAVGAAVGDLLMTTPTGVAIDDDPLPAHFGRGFMLGIGSGLSAGLGMVFGAGIPFSRRRQGRAPA